MVTMLILVQLVVSISALLSSLSSMMFLTVFAFINHGVFLAMTAKVPSFRPHFRFYNAWIGLICALACFVSMFFINWWTALIAWVVAFILYYVTSERHIETQWGTLREAQHYSTALKAALNLRHIMPHPKLYRPNVVLLIDGNPACHTASITFMEQMLHDQGMAIVARMFPAETPISDIVKERTRIGIRNKTTDGHIFYELVAAESRQEALEKVGAKGLENSLFKDAFEQIGRVLSLNAIGKAVPVVSAVIAALIDTAQMNKVLEFADIFYQKRFIIEKEGRIRNLIETDTIIDTEIIEDDTSGM